MRFNAESNATEDLRGGMGWETRENAPKNGGRPEGTRPERLRYGAATKNQRGADGFPQRTQRKRRSAGEGHRCLARRDRGEKAGTDGADVGQALPPANRGLESRVGRRKRLPHLFHEVSRAEGPSQQATQTDRLSHFAIALPPLPRRAVCAAGKRAAQRTTGRGLQTPPKRRGNGRTATPWQRFPGTMPRRKLR